MLASKVYWVQNLFCPINVDSCHGQCLASIICRFQLSRVRYLIKCYHLVGPIKSSECQVVNLSANGVYLSGVCCRWRCNQSSTAITVDPTDSRLRNIIRTWILREEALGITLSGLVCSTPKLSTLRLFKARRSDVWGVNHAMTKSLDSNFTKATTN